MRFSKNCSELSAPGHYPDYETMPAYSIVEKQHGASKPPELLLRITMPTEAFGGASIVRLGCKLMSDFRQERAVQALIFDDRESAKKLALGFTDQHNNGKYLWHLKGRFELNRGSGQTFVEFLMPVLEDGLPTTHRVRYLLSSDLAKSDH
jgi:hypothetical protein